MTEDYSYNEEFLDDLAEDDPEEAVEPVENRVTEPALIPAYVPAREAVVILAPVENRCSGRIRRPPDHFRDYVMSHVNDLYE